MIPQEQTELAMKIVIGAPALGAKQAADPAFDLLLGGEEGLTARIDGAIA
jgi:hypothetical protein